MPQLRHRLALGRALTFALTAALLVGLLAMHLMIPTPAAPTPAMSLAASAPLPTGSSVSQTIGTPPEVTPTTFLGTHAAATVTAPPRAWARHCSADDPTSPVLACAGTHCTGMLPAPGTAAPLPHPAGWIAPPPPRLHRLVGAGGIPAEPDTRMPSLHELSINRT